MRILLLEDSFSTGELLLQILGEKHDVIWVENGLDGVKQLEHIKAFDLVVSDYNMPLMNGLEFLTILRQTCEDTPVILFTACNDLNNDKIRVKQEYGIQEVINKDLDQLINYINKV